MKILSHVIGKINHQEIIKYQLIADSGTQVNILNYGGIISGIWVPDYTNNFANVVLAYDNLDSYITNPGYLGAIIGRHSGRIGMARFKLNDTIYNLAKNNGEHNLHGGNIGLDKRIWQVTQLADGLKLTYLSPQFEEGFPANVHFEVCYQLSEPATLSIIYKAYPDAATIINLTNHSYFNLSGSHNSGTGQILQIVADEYCEIDQSALPTGKRLPVENTAFDFRVPKLIQSDMHANELQVAGGFDHPFILANTSSPNIILFDAKTRRELKIMTTEKAVIFYTGNFLANPNLVNGGRECINHLGICLETQNIPNAINLANCQAPIYSPQKPYLSTTIWQFGVR
ncbi:MAG: galactose mutarotase-like enzyme [Burkholderiales bacterium]|jgi:aldose 1-epimerase|nr:galactose mutarotase-like enzyme [Burkholderiales bacterium]